MYKVNEMFHTIYKTFHCFRKMVGYETLRPPSVTLTGEVEKDNKEEDLSSTLRNRFGKNNNSNKNLQFVVCALHF